MNKLQTLLLNDYLKDPTPTRLALFAGRMNPNFKLSKSNSPQLIQLITDYKADPSKGRLKIIESFLSVSPIPKTSVTPSQMKKMTPREIEVKRTEKTEYEKKRDELSRLKSTPDWGSNGALRDKIYSLQEEVNALEREMGMFDEKPPEETYFAIVTGILGHWEDPSSIAYELIHGTQPRLVIDSGQNFEIILQWLQMLSGQQLRPWLVQTNKGYGTMSGKFKEQVTLTDQRSGLPPIKENGVSLRFDGTNVTEDNAIGAQTLSAIPSVQGVGAVGKVSYTAPKYSPPRKMI